MISGQSLTCPKGASLTFEIDMDTGSDLTGATAQWALCESWFDNAKVYLTKTGTGDGLFIGQDGGVWKITVNLAPTDTLDIPSGLLYHDCKVLLQSGDVEDVANGPFSLDPSVNIFLTNAPITRNLHAVQLLGRLGQNAPLTVAWLAKNLLATQSLFGLGQSAAGTVTATLSAETIQFFDRLIAMPSTPRQTAYATLIDALVTAGVWAKLDALFIFAASERTTSLTNLTQEPHRGFLDTATAIPTFTADSGWSGCGPAGLSDVNVNFNPSTAGGNYVQNDAMICAWQIGSVIERVFLVNETASDSKIELIPQWQASGPVSNFAINGTGTEPSAPAPADLSGFWLMQRTAANASELHHNDTLLGTSSVPSAALINQNIIVTPQTNTVACLGIGGSLNSAQQTAFYNAVRAYMTAVGVP